MRGRFLNIEVSVQQYYFYLLNIPTSNHITFYCIMHLCRNDNWPCSWKGIWKHKLLRIKMQGCTRRNKNTYSKDPAGVAGDRPVELVWSWSNFQVLVHAGPVLSPRKVYPNNHIASLRDTQEFLSLSDRRPLLWSHGQRMIFSYSWSLLLRSLQWHVR